MSSCLRRITDTWNTSVPGKILQISQARAEASGNPQTAMPGADQPAPAPRARLERNNDVYWKPLSLRVFHM